MPGFLISAYPCGRVDDGKALPVLRKEVGDGRSGGLYEA
jgi:hypothetical protein